MDDKKILDMRLEDEPFLNSKANFYQNLIGLHNRGIYTVNDFINMDLKKIPEKRRRYEFLRIIEVLRYKYFGEDLTCDFLLKSHIDSFDGYFRQDCLKLGIPFIERVYNRFVQSNIDKSNLTMIDYMKDYDIRNGRAKYLVDFYLEYIKTKEDKKEDTKISTELEVLKTQLSSLIKQKEDLDKQIIDVQNQIKIMSEAKNNVRK